MPDAFTYTTHSMRGAPIPLTRSQISAASKKRSPFLDLLREGGWPSLAEGVEIHALPTRRKSSVMWETARSGFSGLTTRQADQTCRSV